MEERDVIIGGGEVGYTLYSIMKSEVENVSVLDTDPKKQINSDLKLPVDLLHICIPCSQDFVNIVEGYDQKFNPTVIILHTTMTVGTSELMQGMTKTPVITSPVRGVHDNFVADMLLYPKWIAFNGVENQMIKDKINKRFDDMNIHLKWKDNGRICEMAKLYCDTTYRGWMIAYRFMVDEICRDPDIWEYAQEIHDHRGDRPVMYSDGKNKIGGHCIIPNLNLLIPDYLSTHIRRVIKRYG